MHLLFFFLSLCIQDKFEPVVHKVSDGIYVHITYKALDSGPFACNGLIVEQENQVILIDAGCDDLQSAYLLEWIEQEISKPIAFCIISHAHDDRIGGQLSLRKAGIPIISTSVTRQMALKKGFFPAKAALPTDSLLFEDQTPIRILFPGQGHSYDNIVAWFPNQDLLFGGCLVKSCDTKMLGNTTDANMKNWLLTIKRLIDEFGKPAIVIPGHGSWECENILGQTLELLK